MKSFSTAAVLAAICITAMPVAAMADTVHGRDDYALEAALRDQGTPVEGVEEWGELIRGWVKDANGKTAMQFFDADTLQPVTL